MIYTIKELAKISKISVRTLHWYDEIGLLKPSYKGHNTYRYYEDAQLLMLQQILFFKELGFNLEMIRKLLSQNDFDNIKALSLHRTTLKKDIARKISLIETIDKTIQQLKGEKMMKDEELYYGFERARQEEYEKYLVTYRGLDAEKILLQNQKQTAKWDKEEWDDVKNQGDALHKALAEKMEQSFGPETEEVQRIIHRHYQMTARFWDASKEVYIVLSELYVKHLDFKKFFDVYHPKMTRFIGEAMRIYAHKNL